MVENVYLVDSTSINPYHNQAVMAYLFDHIPDDSLVFMLSRNNDSVVIGKDSNAYKEVNNYMLENEHTYIVRSETGKIITYNDLGTINFAYFVYLNNHNIVSQNEVIWKALRQVNAPVVMNENSELLLNGLKVVDSTYYINNERCIHFGSIYWDCDKGKRTRLLKDKKNASSIINLTDYDPCITYPQIKKRLLQALADKYGPVYLLTIPEDLERYVEHYRSLKYIYDTDHNYTISLSDNYEFGKLQIYVELLKNKINKVDVYLDEDKQEVKDLIEKIFTGLVVDDNLFDKKLRMNSSEHDGDFIKLYESIKRDSYNI